MSKRIKAFSFLIFINIFSMVCGIIFEYPLIRLGMLSHLIEPKILGVSWIATIMYMPWVSAAYFTGKIIHTKLKLNGWLSYFIAGIVTVFVIDTVFVNMAWYRYNIYFLPKIFNVPIDAILAEGALITIFIFLSKNIWNRLQNVLKSGF